MDFRQFLILHEAEEVIADVDKAMKRDNLYIDPATKKPWRLGSEARQLKTILNNHLKNKGKASDLWCHFSDVPKLGIYAKSQYAGTPFGIYAYPLHYVIEKNGNVPYANDRPFVIVFKVKDKSKILSIPNYNDEKFKGKLLKKKISSEVKAGLPFMNLKKIIDQNKEKIDQLINKFIENKIPKNFQEEARTIYRDIASELIDLLVYSYDISIGITPYEKLMNLNFNNLYYKCQYAVTDRITESNRSNRKKIQDFLDKYFQRNMKNFPHYWFDHKYAIYDGKIKFNEDYLIALHKRIEDKLFHYFKGSKESFIEKSKKLNQQIEEMGKREYDYKNPPGDKVFKTQEGKAILKLIHDDYRISRFIKKKKIKTFSVYLLNKILGSLKKYISSSHEKKDIKTSIPFKDQLEKIANAYDLDIKSYIKRIRDKDIVNKGERFIYLITREIVNDLRYSNPQFKGNPGWAWTKMLKSLGIKGVADRHNTGTIHTNEPTQGVFFDSSILEVVKIINKTHAAPEIRWSSLLKKHTTDYPERIEGFPKSQDPKIRAFFEMIGKIGNLGPRIQLDVGLTKISSNADLLIKLIRTVILFLNKIDIDKSFIDDIKSLEVAQNILDVKSCVNYRIKVLEGYLTKLEGGDEYSQVKQLINKLQVAIQMCDQLRDFLQNQIYQKYWKLRYQKAVKSHF